MDKYQRRAWFDRLVELRRDYRATEQTATEWTVTSVIAYAESLLEDPEALEAAVGPSAETIDNTSQAA